MHSVHRTFSAKSHGRVSSGYVPFGFESQRIIHVLAADKCMLSQSNLSQTWESDKWILFLLSHHDWCHLFGWAHCHDVPWVRSALFVGGIPCLWQDQGPYVNVQWSSEDRDNAPTRDYAAASGVTNMPGRSPVTGEINDLLSFNGT